jgi:hypothetical protein
MHDVHYKHDNFEKDVLHRTVSRFYDMREFPTHS